MLGVPLMLRESVGVVDAQRDGANEGVLKKESEGAEEMVELKEAQPLALAERDCVRLMDAVALGDSPKLLNEDGEAQDDGREDVVLHREVVGAAEVVDDKDALPLALEERVGEGLTEAVGLVEV